MLVNVATKAINDHNARVAAPSQPSTAQASSSPQREETSHPAEEVPVAEEIVRTVEEDAVLEETIRVAEEIVAPEVTDMATSTVAPEETVRPAEETIAPKENSLFRTITLVVPKEYALISPSTTTVKSSWVKRFILPSASAAKKTKDAKKKPYKNEKHQLQGNPLK